ncbi:formate/nitrite transporter family protein [Allorhizobium sp. BGMRC 0089]|uniref:formate/nitrite transporter family protein n=1 Tax=Allorhizobium sonneratiae TaxID=2934936 RepID=UPI00203342CC|nr:formate/nitrite transporter family protein [Allorhizobium sonneratiae]MCM2290895.1 formate/nitrite transporter family protein [Allorhizobium sonneratiae]
MSSSEKSSTPALKPSAQRAQKPHQSKSPGLSRKDQEEVEDRAKLRPVAVYEIVRKEGEDELSRPTSSLIWSGFAAGLSIGFSVLTQAALRDHLPDAPWRPLVECWGYSVGFIIVILARQQLFTEITLSAVLPFLARPGLSGGLSVLRLWCLVFLANMAGTALFGLALATDLFYAPGVQEAALAIARETTSHSASATFMHGIMAGWLIATIVWLLPSAQSASFLVIALITYLIALFGLAHIVAGSVEAFLLVFKGELGVFQALWQFFVPALAGNIIGGAALFALISYAQIADELFEN